MTYRASPVIDFYSSLVFFYYLGRKCRYTVKETITRALVESSSKAHQQKAYHAELTAWAVIRGCVYSAFSNLHTQLFPIE